MACYVLHAVQAACYPFTAAWPVCAVAMLCPLAFPMLGCAAGKLKMW